MKKDTRDTLCSTEINDRSKQTRAVSNFRWLMTKFNVSIDGMAVLLGVSRHTVHSWVYGYKTPSMERMEDMASIFGLSAQRIFMSPAPFSDKEMEHVRNRLEDIINGRADSGVLDKEGLDMMMCGILEKMEGFYE